MDATATNTHKRRADALAQIAADVHMRGLPAPKVIELCDSQAGYIQPYVNFRMDDDDPAAVDVWAGYLNLGATVDTPVKSGSFVSHETGYGMPHELPAGWRELGWAYVHVWSCVHEVTS